jgi:hypothetical protein
MSSEGYVRGSLASLSACYTFRAEFCGVYARWMVVQGEAKRNIGVIRCDSSHESLICRKTIIVSTPSGPGRGRHQIRGEQLYPISSVIVWEVVHVSCGVTVAPWVGEA